MSVKGRVNVRYSPDADALIIELSREALEYGEEVAPGVILHYGRGGRLAEIEILDASKLIADIVQQAMEALRKRQASQKVAETMPA